MVADLAGVMLQLLQEYGLLAIFLALALDSAMLLPVFPGELALVLATERFAKDHASFLFIVVFCSVASTLGNCFPYAVARWGGRGFVERHPKLFLMSPNTRDKLVRLFSRPAGQSLVMFLRALPMLRLLVSLPAGLARMPGLRFVILTFLGNLLFNGALMGLAYEGRRNPDGALMVNARRLRNDYAEPAWLFVADNWLWVLIVIAGLGILAVIVRSVRVRTRPEMGEKGTALGGLATMTLMGMGAFLLIGLWTEPELVFGLLRRGGWDVQKDFGEIPSGPEIGVAVIGGLFLMVGMLVKAIRSHAEGTAKAVQKQRDVKKSFLAQVQQQPAPVRQKPPQ